MKSGRELDNKVSFYVFGGEDCNNVRHYSTNIADAWLVVEKFKSKDYLFSLKNIVKGTFTFSLTDWGGKCSTYEVEAETAPLAICLAALKAVGYEQ